jgi:hypothetical protein
VRGNLSELRARAAAGKLAWGTSIGRVDDQLVLPLRQVRCKGFMGCLFVCGDFLSISWCCLCHRWAVTGFTGFEYVYCFVFCLLGKLA